MQAEINSKCYDPTVSPLADISHTFNQKRPSFWPQNRKKIYTTFSPFLTSSTILKIIVLHSDLSDLKHLISFTISRFWLHSCAPLFVNMWLLSFGIATCTPDFLAPLLNLTGLVLSLGIASSFKVLQLVLLVRLTVKMLGVCKPMSRKRHYWACKAHQQLV